MYTQYNNIIINAHPDFNVMGRVSLLSFRVCIIIIYYDINYSLLLIPTYQVVG